MEASSRRDFLKKAALAGASALMAPELLAVGRRRASLPLRLPEAGQANSSFPGATD